MREKLRLRKEALAKGRLLNGFCSRQFWLIDWVPHFFSPIKITSCINSCAGKAKIEKMSRHLKVKCELLDSARSVVWYFFHAYHFSEVFVASLLDNFLSHTVTLFSLQLEKNRLEQIEKFYPNFIYTQNLGLVRSIWSTHTLIVFFVFTIVICLTFTWKVLTLIELCLMEGVSEFQIAITSERLFKQSVIIKQICKLFPLRRVRYKWALSITMCSSNIFSVEDFLGSITF